MKIGPRPGARTIAALLAVLLLPWALRAHDIPDEIVLQTYVRPAGARLQVLLRVPLIAIADANLPKDGPGYLALPYLDQPLAETANQLASGIVFLENERRLTDYTLEHARISLPSDRSFDAFEQAQAHVRGARLPSDTLVYYNQGFLDLELSLPIASDGSAFSLRVLFGRGMASRTATHITYVTLDGATRTFRIHDDTPLVRLDPTPLQAAWVFLQDGFYRLLNGLDHLLFVLMLALPFRRAADLVRPIAAFAGAHSVSLGIAAFGQAAAQPWLAPVIGTVTALSIVYLAVENALGAGLRWRWVTAMVFGVFHGIGFAIALQDSLQFAGAHPLIALAAYNVGVELAILLVLAIALPASNLLFTAVVPERAGTIVSSVLIGHVAWHWMAERFGIARLTAWPMMDVQLLLAVVRWLLAATVVGGILWFLSGLLRRRPAAIQTEADLPEKSIVDSHRL